MKRFFLFAMMFVSFFFVLPVSTQAVLPELDRTLVGEVNKASEGTFDVVKGDEEQQGRKYLEGLFARSLQITLGLLGLVAVILLVYAGYLWMGASGKADQVEKAKTIIKQVIIGMIILALAYGIISFALTSFAPTGPVER